MQMKLLRFCLGSAATSAPATSATCNFCLSSDCSTQSLVGFGGMCKAGLGSGVKPLCRGHISGMEGPDEMVDGGFVSNLWRRVE